MPNNRQNCDAAQFWEGVWGGFHFIGGSLILPPEHGRRELLLGRESRERLGELERAIKAVGFGAERGGQCQQPGGGDILEIPARKFFAEATAILRESFEAGMTGEFAALGEGLGFQGSCLRLQASRVFLWTLSSTAMRLKDQP